MKSTPRILILKVNHLGDNIVFVPVVAALRQCFPTSPITVVTSPVESELYAGIEGPTERFAPAIREVFNRQWRRPWAAAQSWWRLRRFRADATLVSYDQANFPHLLAKLTGGPIRVGANMRYVRVRGSITHEVPSPSDWNVVRWNWRMGEALARQLSPEVVWPAEPPPPDLRHLAPGAEPGSGPIVIHAGTKMHMRQWPLDRFAALAGRLARDHAVVWVERPETSGVALPPGVTPVRPQSLGELAALVARAKLYIGNNSGPMHLANAFGTPGVIVSGPSSYGWDPYWFRERWTVLRHPQLACLPCESPATGVDFCGNTAAPLACLQSRTVDRVAAACQERLAQG
jgi:ADP-heptose:LPS heptosyltransferase